MGEIFDAAVYDIKSMTCFRTDVDKLFANCYAYSGAVICIHYLLRQKPYRVIWGGHHFLKASIKESTLDCSEEFLYGFSAFVNPLNEEHIAYLKEGICDKTTLSKIDFIVEKSKLWTKLNVWNEARSEHAFHAAYNLACDKYSHIYHGYLLNHSKCLAVDLGDYFELSEFRHQGSDSFTRIALDPIPVLTKTEKGIGMDAGVSAETTRKLGGAWCGDVLEIKDEMPDGYKLIKCCFVGIWERARFLYKKFGLDSENFIVSDENGTRYEAIPYSFSLRFDKILGKVLDEANIKVDDSEEEGYVNFDEGYINCKTDSVKISDLTDDQLHLLLFPKIP